VESDRLAPAGRFGVRFTERSLQLSPQLARTRNLDGRSALLDAKSSTVVDIDPTAASSRQ
jgi:hypothetical protein